jgi:hypothetical protein
MHNNTISHKVSAKPTGYGVDAYRDMRLAVRTWSCSAHRTLARRGVISSAQRLDARCGSAQFIETCVHLLPAGEPVTSYAQGRRLHSIQRNLKMLPDTSTHLFIYTFTAYFEHSLHC